MAQHDYVIDNQTAPNFRADLNNALAAIVSTNSGGTEPSTTYGNMLWYDSSANILKIRNEADDAWISVAYLDQSADAFRILDNTQVTTTAGSQTGLLGDQATATWEAGTGTTESLVSPAKVKAAIEALAPASVPTTAQVLSATAGASVGGVGTYAWVQYITVTDTDLTPGTTVAGSAIRYAGVTYRTDAFVQIATQNTLSGTWRAMGFFSQDDGSLDTFGLSLVLRIS